MENLKQIRDQLENCKTKLKNLELKVSQFESESLRQPPKKASFFGVEPMPEKGYFRYVGAFINCITVGFTDKVFSYASHTLKLVQGMKDNGFYIGYINGGFVELFSFISANGNCSFNYFEYEGRLKVQKSCLIYENDTPDSLFELVKSTLDYIMGKPVQDINTQKADVSSTSSSTNVSGSIDIPICARVEYKSKKVEYGTKDLLLRIPIITREGKMTYVGPYRGFYNPSTKTYYIEKYSFDSIEQRGHPMVLLYGVALVNKNEFGKDLEAYSVLSKCGYNVNSETNLSRAQRRAILESVLRYHKASKYQIISLLEWLISTRENRPNMDNAVAKWEDDLKYVKDNLY